MLDKSVRAPLHSSFQGAFFCMALESSHDPIHFNPEVFAPWGMSLSRVRCGNYAEITPLGFLSSWDQMLHSYTFIISHIYLGSGTVKVDMQQHWRGMDKNRNNPWQQSKYGSKWNNQPT